MESSENDSIPIQDKRISYSSSGRYAFRELPYDGEGPHHGVLVFDLELETVHEVYFKTRIRSGEVTAYWVDEDHLGVIYRSRFRCFLFRIWGHFFGKRFHVKGEKMQLYKLDFTKKKHKPIKTRTLKDSTGTRWIPTFTNAVDEFVMLDGNEYLFMCTFKVQKSCFNNMFCSLVPRKFDCKVKLPEVHIDLGKALHAANIDVTADPLINDRWPKYSLFHTTVRGSNVYLRFSYNTIFKMDMQKYFNVLRKTSQSPAYEDFCSKAATLEPKKPFFSWTPKNGYYFSEDWCEESQEDVTNLRDIETGEVTRTFDYDENYTFSMHPSGHCVRFRRNIAFQRPGNDYKYYLEKENTYTKVEPLPKGQTLNGLVPNIKAPRFIREGREEQIMEQAMEENDIRIPRDNERISYSPSGRYAFREFKNRGGSKNAGVLVFDFEMESVHEVYFKSVILANILDVYWVDDEHLGVINRMRFKFFPNSDPELIKGETIQLVKLDFTKKNHCPIKTKTLKRSQGRNCAGTLIGSRDSLDEFLVLDKTEYILLVNYDLRSGPDGEPHETKMFLRFIPRQFHEKDTLPYVLIDPKAAIQAANIDITADPVFDNYYDMYTNFATMVRGSNIYMCYSHRSILKLDVKKYFDELRKASEPPAYEVFCSRSQFRPAQGPFFWNLSQDGYYFAEDENEQRDALVVNLRDIETGQILRTFNYDRQYTMSFHPSGQCLRFRRNIEFFRRPEIDQIFLEKDHTFTKLDQFPEFPTLEDLVLEKLRFKNKNINAPRFIREGRKEVTMSLDDVIALAPFGS